MKAKTSFSQLHISVLALGAGYVFIAFYLGVFLQYDFLKSDVLGYWQDSFAWREPFHPFHVPAYPLTLAALRGITFGALPPIVLMMSINLFTFLASGYLIHRIITDSGGSDSIASMGVFLFGLWPFVGLTYTVNPLADMPAMFLFLMGLYLLLRSRTIPAALFLSVSMLAHKAMWVFVGALLVMDILKRKELFSKSRLTFIFITLFPLGMLWTLGALYHHSAAWLFSGNLQVEMASRSGLPLLDGILGTLMEGSAKSLLKGSLIAALAIISALTLYVSLRLKYPNCHYGLALALASLILFAVLNQYEIWAAARFSRLMVIPIMLAANTQPKMNQARWWRSPTVIVILFLLFLTQYAYAWYIGKVYFE